MGLGIVGAVVIIILLGIILIACSSIGMVCLTMDRSDEPRYKMLIAGVVLGIFSLIGGVSYLALKKDKIKESTSVTKEVLTGYNNQFGNDQRNLVQKRKEEAEVAAAQKTAEEATRKAADEAKDKEAKSQGDAGELESSEPVAAEPAETDNSKSESASYW
jgi:uncharacterized membrane protein YeiB